MLHAVEYELENTLTVHERPVMYYICLMDTRMSYIKHDQILNYLDIVCMHGMRLLLNRQNDRIRLNPSSGALGADLSELHLQR